MGKQRKGHRNHSENVGAGNEHLVTKAAAFLCAISKFHIGYYHPQISRELDSLGVDLLTFLQNGFSFPTQVKSRYFDLKTHYRNYPYIHGVAINGDKDVALISTRLGETIRRHGEEFFSLKSCVPPEIHGGKLKNVERIESPLLTLLRRASPLVAYYHEGLRRIRRRGQRGELWDLGATGIVFLRNGFAIFIRKEIRGLPPASVPCLWFKAEEDPEKIAKDVAAFVNAVGTNFFTAA